MDVPEIDIAEAVRRWGAGTPIVDVREPHEWVEVHVSGAMLIPLGDVADRLVGGRSRRAAEILRPLGFDAVNIAGGTLAWIADGHPVVEGDEIEA